MHFYLYLYLYFWAVVFAFVLPEMQLSKDIAMAAVTQWDWFPQRTDISCWCIWRFVIFLGADNRLFCWLRLVLAQSYPTTDFSYCNTDVSVICICVCIWMLLGETGIPRVLFPRRYQFSDISIDSDGQVGGWWNFHWSGWWLFCA